MIGIRRGYGFDDSKEETYKVIVEYGLEMDENNRTKLCVVHEFKDYVDNPSVEELVYFFGIAYNMFNLATEQLHAAFIDSEGNLIGVSNISTGGYKSCKMYMKKLAMTALLLNAYSVFIFHNHPFCEEAEPSEGDFVCYGKVCELAELIDIQVTDSIIFTKKEWIGIVSNTPREIEL